jgi:hypothetical protein
MLNNSVLSISQPHTLLLPILAALHNIHAPCIVLIYFLGHFDSMMNRII